MKKYVTYKNLKIGQEIHGFKDGDLTCGFLGYVKSINPNFVTVEKWQRGGEESQYSTTYTFAVNMTEEEIAEKYKKESIEVLRGIQNTLHMDQMGEHEMWNSWLYGMVYEIAKACKDEGMKIIGHCKLPNVKTNLITEDVQDIGVCAEYSNGERIWCHYSSKDLNQLLEYNKELLSIN